MENKKKYLLIFENLIKSLIIPLATFFVIGLTQIINLKLISRYDLLFLFFLFLYLTSIFVRYATLKEIFIALVFQILGLFLEIHKVSIGAWNYPESSIVKIMKVPLFSTFMYASVAMFVIQLWKRFQIKLSKLPNVFFILILISTIYANFFMIDVSPGFRRTLILVVIILFLKSRFEFMLFEEQRSIPLLLIFLVMGLVLWIAENIATWLGAWEYSYQKENWVMIEYSKINSWFLLIVVFVIIANFLINFPGKKYPNRIEV